MNSDEKSRFISQGTKRLKLRATSDIDPGSGSIPGVEISLI